MTDSTGHMPWDNLFDDLYPSKKTSIRKFIVNLKDVEISYD